MDFDDMLVELGEMGKYQIKVYILVCLPIIFSAANSLTYVFTAGVPKYRCFIPNCEDGTSDSYDASWLEYAIPNDEDGNNTYEPTQCTRYKQNQNITNSACTEDAFTSEEERCYDWVFDKERTIVNDWKITCLENQWKLSLVGTSHFAGILVGSAFFGIIADRYGRKLVFIFCILLMCVSGAAQVLSPGYLTFTILVFVNAFGTAGIYPSAFILGVEMVGRSKRELTGIVLNYFYAIGEASVALIAWIFEDWVILQLAVSAPCILFVVYYWLIPESVRWLLAKDKKEEARNVVYKVAKHNNVKLSEEIVASFEKEIRPLNISCTYLPTEEPKVLPAIKFMLRSRKLVVRFLIIILVWSVNAFVYYGLSLNSITISGNKYLNFALACLIEIPGYTLSWICMEKFGRKPTLVGSFLLCGFTCIATIFLPSDLTWLEITLFLIGKLGITSSFGVVYVHTAEMLPTIIRSGGVGTASTMARVGAMLAPFVPLLGVYVHELPMALFGSVAVIAGLLALKLPETVGSKLPEGIEDAERI